tara:strand:- start:1392 stop:1568 length:177 start_codon:yes stop_codon:yes gene_type:complete
MLTMSRRKNGVRKDWKKKLTELNILNKKLKRDPENTVLQGKISTIRQRTVMPKGKKRD